MHLISLQYARFAAAFAVVLLHATVEVGAIAAPPQDPLLVGAFGVDLFFVISGFVMWITTAGRPAEPWRFLRRRIARIAPLYWALTLLAAAKAAAVGELSLAHLLASLFFIPMHDPQWGTIVPVLVVGWTLNMEMFFYLLFALALQLGERPRLVAIVGMLTAIGLGRWFVFEPQGAILTHLTDPLVLEFAGGVALGEAWRRGWLKGPSRASLRLIVIGAFAAAAAGGVALAWRVFPGADLTHWRGVGYGVPALFACAAFLVAEPLVARRPVGLLKFLGDASYSTYLAHTMCIAAFGVAFRALPDGAIGPADYWPAVALVVAAAHVAGAVVHVALEKPLTARAQRLLEGGRPAAPRPKGALN